VHSFRAALLLGLAMAPVRARADAQVVLSPGPGYRIDWTPQAAGRVFANPQVDRQGPSSVDRWFQVAPGGGALAMWVAGNGVAVFKSTGAELWRREAGVTAFRFSPGGDRLAVASAKGIEVVALGEGKSRNLATLAGVEWLRWTDFGLAARTRSALKLVSEDGSQRTLAALPPGAVVAAAQRRVVYFATGALIELELTSGARTGVTKLAREPVINAELSPDGATVLFATKRGVYVRRGKAEVRQLVGADRVHSLFFSPDGSAYLWAANDGGAVVGKAGDVPLPRGVRSARFRPDTGGLVLTAEDGVSTWDPATGARSIIGGISSADGVNLAGDLAGGAGVALYYKKTGYEKKVDIPTTPRP
jgi:hypothetical protein